MKFKSLTSSQVGKCFIFVKDVIEQDGFESVVVYLIKSIKHEFDSTSTNSHLTYYKFIDLSTYNVCECTSDCSMLEEEIRIVERQGEKL
jgi:hypothetical protein